MAKCVYCESDTQLYETEVPVCLECANNPERRRNFQEARKPNTPPERKSESEEPR